MYSPHEIELTIKAVKPYLTEVFGVERIGYFGSFANGTYSKESDLDVLVYFNQRIGWKFFDLKYYLEAVIGSKVDLVTERSLKKQWKHDILQQVKYI